jgi:hypothetical protein
MIDLERSARSRVLSWATSRRSATTSVIEPRRFSPDAAAADSADSAASFILAT